jgi:sucrose phosphorylase
VKRSLLAHAVLLTMPGLPAIYFHSMVGSVNDVKGMKESGQNRRINRQKFEYKYLEGLLDNPDTRQSVILNGLKKLIDVRKNETAFDPYGEFEVISSVNGVFSLCRKGNSEEQSVYAHFNLTQQTQKVKLDGNCGWTDIITNRSFDGEIQLQPLDFAWLKKRSKSHWVL